MIFEKFISILSIIMMPITLLLRFYYHFVHVGVDTLSL